MLKTRNIDGIPDYELVKPYLGEFALLFKETVIYAHSPIDGHTAVTCYDHTLNDLNKIVIRFSRSKQGVLIIYKHKIPHCRDMWVNKVEKLIPLTNPNGIEQSNNYINYLIKEFK